jgi:hypothetical protein
MEIPQAHSPSGLVEDPSHPPTRWGPLRGPQPAVSVPWRVGLPLQRSPLQAQQQQQQQARPLA